MISFHYENALAGRVGAEHGLDEADFERGLEQARPLCRRFAADAAAGAHGFMTLPGRPGPAREIRAWAGERRGAFRNFVQIGIGGSALGAIALHGALSHRFHNLLADPDRGVAPRFHVLDNVDPEETQALFELLDPKTTLYHVVTKSGDTTETMAGFLPVLERLKAALGEQWRQNLVVTTDPAKGFLRDFARREQVRAFDLPEAVGGRFSVLTPVGLVPAAVLGIDPEELLAGAAEEDARARREDPRANPACLFALLAQLLDSKRGKRIHVLMPYSRALRDLADWFRQLWAESLGKNPRTGPTPVFALGTTDQHSQVQLYAEGPNDKFIVFMEVRRFRQELVVPEALPAGAGPAFLQGRRFSEILGAMKAGTEQALTQANRPNATLRFDAISARTIGAAFYLFEAATLYAGWLYGVNPFDQPGVEAGKKAAFALLGRPGFAAPPRPAPDPRYEAR
jgi:glucose-6-phosphate isomerase